MFGTLEQNPRSEPHSDQGIWREAQPQPRGRSSAVLWACVVRLPKANQHLSLRHTLSKFQNPSQIITCLRYVIQLLY